MPTDLPHNVFHVHHATVAVLQEALRTSFPQSCVTLISETVEPVPGVQMEELNLSRDPHIAVFVRGFLAGLNVGRRGG